MIRRRKHRSWKESGVAVTEFVLTIPFLLIMCAGVVDVGMVLTQYVRLSEATHTGLRLAVSYSTLESGKFISASCPPPVVGIPASQSALHGTILRRVEDLLKLNKVRIDFSTVCLWSEVQPSAVEPSRNTITVTVQAQYNAMFPGISQIPIEISANGPLLN